MRTARWRASSSSRRAARSQRCALPIHRWLIVGGIMLMTSARRPAVLCPCAGGRRGEPRGAAARAGRPLAPAGGGGLRRADALRGRGGAAADRARARPDPRAAARPPAMRSRPPLCPRACRRSWPRARPTCTPSSSQSSGASPPRSASRGCGRRRRSQSAWRSASWGRASCRRRRARRSAGRPSAAAPGPRPTKASPRCEPRRRMSPMPARADE